MIGGLTEDQKKLLIVLYLTTKPPHKPPGGRKFVEKWVKEPYILAIACAGAVEGVFSYDYAPNVRLVGGAYRFVNVSQECIQDLRSLASRGLIEILSLATERHLFIRAYRIAEEGKKLVDELLQGDEGSRLLEEVKKLVCCEHGLVMDACLDEEEGKVVLRCGKGCVREIDDLFKTEDVSYSSTPVVF